MRLCTAVRDCITYIRFVLCLTLGEGLVERDLLLRGHDAERILVELDRKLLRGRSFPVVDL